MRRRLAVVLVVVGLCLALVEPAYAGWTFENSESFMADRRGQMHPCCPSIEMVLGIADTPAVVCAYYSNNLKKKNKGRVSVRSVVYGLDSGFLVGELAMHGNVEKNFWGVCAVLHGAPEPCVVIFDFSLTGFPKLKKKSKQVDGIMVGLIAAPGVETAAALSRSAIGKELYEALPTRLPRFR